MQQNGVIAMAKPISMEKRMDVIKHKQAGESTEDIAKWLFVSKRTVKRVWDKFAATGSVAPEPQNSGRKPLVGDETMDKIVSKIKEQPDMTLLELIDEFDLPISESALCRRLIKLGLTYKKNFASGRTATRRCSACP